LGWPVPSWQLLLLPGHPTSAQLLLLLLLLLPSHLVVLGHLRLPWSLTPLFMQTACTSRVKQQVAA
jgi:hypothetical protein